MVAKTPWLSKEGFTDYNYYCRNFLTVAYLDGKTPSLIMQRGTYQIIKTQALDKDFNKIWYWDSTQEQKKYSGQGSHGLITADVDRDGRDELVIGGAVLDETGQGLWTLEMGHPDICYVADIHPENPGLEIFYGFESKQKTDGICVVDAATGRKLWANKEPTSHLHGQGMAGDVLADHAGMEVLAGERDFPKRWLYSASGELIAFLEKESLTPRPGLVGCGPAKGSDHRQGDPGLGRSGHPADRGTRDRRDGLPGRLPRGGHHLRAGRAAHLLDHASRRRTAGPVFCRTASTAWASSHRRWATIIRPSSASRRRRAPVRCRHGIDADIEFAGTDRGAGPQDRQPAPGRGGVCDLWPSGQRQNASDKGDRHGGRREDLRNVTSPTFVLVNEYEGRFDIYHIDAYRLDSLAEFEMLGFDDFCYPQSVVLIEWADKIEPAIRNIDLIRIELAHAGEHTRTIRIRNLPPYVRID